MTTFQVRTTVLRPVGVVNEAFLNPDNFPFWMTDLEKFEVIRGSPGLAGSVGRLHYSRNGRSYVMQDEMIECEPGRRYLSKVSGDAVEARVETMLQAIGDRTEIVMTWSGRGRIFPLNVLLPLLRRKMARQAKAELETFKNLVESRGARFSP